MNSEESTAVDAADSWSNAGQDYESNPPANRVYTEEHPERGVILLIGQSNSKRYRKNPPQPDDKDDHYQAHDYVQTRRFSCVP
jgi:hypothetical protein